MKEKVRILVKKLNVGDRVEIKNYNDYNVFKENNKNYCGITKGIQDCSKQEATITGIGFVTDVLDNDILQIFKLDIDEERYMWSIDMFEKINGEDNAYKDIVSNPLNEDYIPLGLLQ